MIQLYESLAGIVNQLSTRLYNVKYVYIYIYLYLYFIYILYIYIYSCACLTLKRVKLSSRKKKGNGRNSDDYNPVRLMEITNSNNESLFGKHSGKPMLRWAQVDNFLTILDIQVLWFSLKIESGSVIGLDIVWHISSRMLTGQYCPPRNLHDSSSNHGPSKYPSVASYNFYSPNVLISTPSE